MKRKSGKSKTKSTSRTKKAGKLQPFGKTDKAVGSYVPEDESSFENDVIEETDDYENNGDDPRELWF